MKHPAKFTASIIDEIEKVLADAGVVGNILDPFAGIGGIHELHDRNASWHTWGVELEPEWAYAREVNTIQGDATALPLEWANHFQAVITSPPYGNRMADKDMRPTVAATYMKDLGRESSPGSMNHLQWGTEYQRFAVRFMQEAWRVLEPNGPFLLNVKNHPRNKKVIDVVGWYADTAHALGWQIEETRCIPTPGMRKGANRAGIVEAEALIVMRRPW